MPFKNLRAVNDEGGIFAERLDGTGVYMDPGSDLHAVAMAGLLGEIAPYVAPLQVAPVDLYRAKAYLPRLAFAQALRRIGMLSHAQVMTFLAGGIPAPIAALISALPEDMQEQAQEAMAGAQDFYRIDPIWTAAVAARAVTDAQLDAVFGITD